MKPSRLDKTIMGGHQALGSTVVDHNREPHASSADRDTIKTERPNPALLRTHVLQAVAAPLPVPLPAPPALPAARAPSPGSASGVRAAAPVGVPFARAPAAPAPVAPALRPCSPTDDPRLIMLTEPNGVRAAGIRRLRDTIAKKGLPRVMAVSSAQPKDGATTCALNLALAIAEHTSQKLLIIDANFAAPALAELLGINEYTAPYSAWSAPFALSALTRSLHVATVVRPPYQDEDDDEGSAHIDFPTLARVIDCFQRAGYQHIILDVPAINGSPDTPLILQLAGGVLLAVRAGATTKRGLRSAVEQIDKERALGICFMDAPE